MAYAGSPGPWRARDEPVTRVDMQSVVTLITAKWIFS